MLYLSLKEGILATGPVWRFHRHRVHFHGLCVVFPRGPCGISVGTMWHFHRHSVVFPRQCVAFLVLSGFPVVWGLFVLFSMH